MEHSGGTASSTSTPVGAAHPNETEVDGRRRHYGTFYGITPLPGSDLGGSDLGGDDLGGGDRSGAADPDAPLILMWGNCQAEALRVVLATSPTLGAMTVRVPPVFELTADDVEPLRRLAARASILVSQPVRRGYGDLPVGTDDVAGVMRPGSTVIRWPVIFSAASLPFQAIVRDPRDGANDPPVVPYHDLRTLVSARAEKDCWIDDVSVSACRAVAQSSLAELERRERLHCDIGVSDLLARPQLGDMFTINHPGNRILVELARRIQMALGRPVDAADPGRDLLGEVRTPIVRAAASAMRLPEPISTSWVVRGRKIEQAEIHLAQWRWYRDNPAVVDEGFHRHQQTISQLGLT